MESQILLPPLALNGDSGATQRDDGLLREQQKPQYRNQNQHVAGPSLHDQGLSPLPPPPPTYPPPAYNQGHGLTSLAFPDVPTSALAPIQAGSAQNDRASNKNNNTTTLPPLASLTQGSPQPYSPPHLGGSATTYSPPPSRRDFWPSLNPLTAYYAPSPPQTAGSPGRMDIDLSSAGVAGAASPDRHVDGRAGSVSLDDPDVRMAAEALGDLRADFVSSPPARTTPRLTASPVNGRDIRSPSEPEPLFALLTTSHPLLATTIEGATSVYTNSKNFSPRFKSGAEYVEGYLTPIANTMGSVSRVTGVEGGVRWFLGAGRRRPPSSGADLEAANGGPSKRRKIDTGASADQAPTGMDMQATPGQPPNGDPYEFTKERRASMSTVDTLPAYDDARSPAYEATERQDAGPATATDSRPPSGSSSAWQSRLIMSTSGLSIAMSDESLRSLKYCLRWLRWANDHICGVVNTLKTTLEQHDRRPSHLSSTEASGSTGQPTTADQAMANADDSSAPPPGASHASNLEMAGRIAAMRNDVLKTLRDMIETVSKYAGGALPDNARVLVRKHLTSLPQRFRLASQAGAETAQPASDSGEKGLQEKEKELRDGAQRVLVLAKEGLDMMNQVSGVLDGTIASAEEWCERLGRRRREARESLWDDPNAGAPFLPPVAGGSAAGAGSDSDVKME